MWKSPANRSRQIGSRLQGRDMLSELGGLKTRIFEYSKQIRRLELTTERPDLRKVLIVWIPRCVLLAGNI